MYLYVNVNSTYACYPMSQMIETDSLHPYPIYPNNFLKADFNSVFPTLFFALCFETRMFLKEDFRNMGRFVPQMYHHLGHNEIWDV
jgi:hypothetical protein